MLACLGLAALGCSGTAESSGDGAAGSVENVGLSLQPASAEAVLAAVQANPSRTVVMNVWATWCVPCREEFPDLMRLRNTYAKDGLDLVLVSADFDDQVDAAQAFLAEQGVDFPTWLKTGKDMEFIDTLNPEWGGALPATFVYDADGELRAFWEGKATYEEMEQRVLPILKEADH